MINRLIAVNPWCVLVPSKKLVRIIETRFAEKGHRRYCLKDKITYVRDKVKGKVKLLDAWSDMPVGGDASFRFFTVEVARGMELGVNHEKDTAPKLQGKIRKCKVVCCGIMDDNEIKPQTVSPHG